MPFKDEGALGKSPPLTEQLCNAFSHCSFKTGLPASSALSKTRGSSVNVVLSLCLPCVSEADSLQIPGLLHLQSLKHEERCRIFWGLPATASKGTCRASKASQPWEEQHQGGLILRTR